MFLDLKKQMEKDGTSALLAPTDKEIEAAEKRAAAARQRELDRAKKQAEELKKVLEQFYLENRMLDLDSFTQQIADQIVKETEEAKKKLYAEPNRPSGLFPESPGFPGGEAELRRQMKVAREQDKIDEDNRKKAEAKAEQDKKDAEQAAIDGVQIAINALQQIYAAQLLYADKEIALQEKRVMEATRLAELGNTAVLEEEKARLNAAQAERDKIAKKQLQLNAILTASNQALALSEAIIAVVKAAQGDPYTLALRVAAAAAALIAGIAAVTVAFQNASGQGYADGVIGINGPGTGTSDSIHARLSKGESVMTAAETKAFRPYLQGMRDGTFYNMVNQRTPAFMGPSNDYRALEKKLDGVIEAIGLTSTKVNARVDERGVAIMTERYSRYDKNRFR